ncbi:MAG: (2Fe-2S)-binding protein [Bacteroidota bacterium]
MEASVSITFRSATQSETWRVSPGTNLRQALLARGLSPYVRLTRRLNCGGRGICATCGIWIIEGDQAPEHWHDRLAQRFGYPRLSCKVTVDRDLTITPVPDKWIWGGRRNRPQITSTAPE